MKFLIINLLNFNNSDLAGAGYFFKRINSYINWDDDKAVAFDRIIVLHNKSINPVDVFSFKPSVKLAFVQFHLTQNFLSRIFLEQFVLPFWLLNKQGCFISPTPAIPLVSKLLNKNLILIPTIHDMIPFHVKEKYPLLRRIYIKFISKMAARVADKVITVSEFSKLDIASIAKIDLKKIFVVYNFVPYKFKQHISNDEYFLTVCTIEPGKNIETMVKGFKVFLENNPQYSHYKYMIAGKFGWGYKAIISLIDDLKLNDKVIFTGYLAEDAKINLIKGCVAMLYLSKYEGFGIPPLEAMAFGKPSIVSDRASLPEVVGDTGIVQDADDYHTFGQNLKELIINRKFYIDKLPSQFQKFDPQKQVNKFLTVIND